MLKYRKTFSEHDFFQYPAVARGFSKIAIINSQFSVNAKKMKQRERERQSQLDEFKIFPFFGSLSLHGTSNNANPTAQCRCEHKRKRKYLSERDDIKTIPTVELN